MGKRMRTTQMRFPVAIDSVTREPMTLERALADPGRIAGRGELTERERIALVRARWEAGAWFDLFYCDQLVDLPRALAELKAGTTMGRELQRITERAIEIVFEEI
jgi:hypothetical protein